MKSVILESYGDVDAFKKVEEQMPEPKENEVLLEVAATSLNAIDWKIRAGKLKDMLDLKLPIIMGWDVSGVVKKAGDKVSTFKPGDEVYGRAKLFKPGGFTEYMVIEENLLIAKPENLSFEEAAAIPLTGTTAWTSLSDEANLKKGEQVLIHGGSGGIGSFAVQFAKYFGATVAATASGKNEDYVRSLGADLFIDYKKEDFSNRVDAFDVVLDTQGGEVQENSFKVLKHSGRLVSLISEPDEDQAKSKNIAATYLNNSKPSLEQMKKIGKLMSEGVIKPPHIEVFPFTLEGVRNAHQAGESGRTKGKLVVKVR